MSLLFQQDVDLKLPGNNKNLGTVNIRLHQSCCLCHHVIHQFLRKHKHACTASSLQLYTKSRKRLLTKHDWAEFFTTDQTTIFVVLMSAVEYEQIVWKICLKLAQKEYAQLKIVDRLRLAVELVRKVLNNSQYFNKTLTEHENRPLLHGAYYYKKLKSKINVSIQQELDDR